MSKKVIYSIEIIILRGLSMIFSKKDCYCLYNFIEIKIINGKIGKIMSKNGENCKMIYMIIAEKIINIGNSADIMSKLCIS